VSTLQNGTPVPRNDKTLLLTLRGAAIGYRSVGIEIDQDYFRLAETAMPKLAALYPTFEGDSLEFHSSDYPQEAIAESQLTMALAESEMRYQVRKK